MMASQTTLEKKIVELENSKQIPQNTRPKIQRVAGYLRNRKIFEKHYSPKLVSIGPIHHDNTNLKTGEKYKLMWAAKYLENTGRNPRDLHKKIDDKINELKGHFSDNILTLTSKSLEGFGSLEEKLSWMLFVDGCSLLHILEKAMLDAPGQMNIKVDQLALVMMDVLLLENQLPYEILKLLWKDNNENELIKCMRDFLKCHHWATPTPENKRNGWWRRIQETSNIVPDRKGKEQNSTILITNESETPSEKEKDMVSKGKGEGEHIVSIPDKLQSGMEEEEEGEHSVSIPLPNESQSETPTHLLDLMHKLNVTTSKSKNNSNEAKIREWSQKKNEFMPITYRGIEDLKAAGIKLKASFTSKPTDIFFSEGWITAKLTIPKINVNNFTASTLLNLIAYEICLDFDNDYEICSYVALMDSLIDHPQDVKVLRSKGILCTFWSDEEVASLFNIIGTDLVANIDIYFEVQLKLCEHYFNKYKTWIALAFRTYFKNPWTIIAFLAAFIALALTFIQTMFTVHPASK